MAEELKGPVYIPRDCSADGEACAGKTAQAEVLVHCEASFYSASWSDNMCSMNQEQVAKALRARLEKLEQTIVHADVKDHFLSFAKKNLDELERSWIQHGPKHIADAMLPLIEEQLARVEVAVAKYGPTIRIIAG
jgi:hypothetical protein